MKNNGIRRSLATAAMVVVMSTAPAAVWGLDSESVSGASSFIEHFDQDRDGLVSVNEFPGDESIFSSLDVDGSGFIDETEAQEVRPPHGGPDPEAMLDEIDSDGDGMLSFAEFPGPADHFDRLDADGDGLLSADELLAGRPGPAGEDGFANDDADQDGLVSLAEFSGSEDLFDKLDADGDGYISEQEARPAPPRGGPGPLAEAGAGRQ